MEEETHGLKKQNFVSRAHCSQKVPSSIPRLCANQKWEKAAVSEIVVAVLQLLLTIKQKHNAAFNNSIK